VPIVPQVAATTHSKSQKSKRIEFQKDSRQMRSLTSGLSKIHLTLDEDGTQDTVSRVGNKLF